MSPVSDFKANTYIGSSISHWLTLTNVKYDSTEIGGARATRERRVR